MYDWVRESVPLAEVDTALFLAAPPACDVTRGVMLQDLLVHMVAMETSLDGIY